MKNEPMRCPVCGKVLGYATDEDAARRVSLWCKRCKTAVTPTVSREPEVTEP